MPSFVFSELIHPTQTSKYFAFSYTLIAVIGISLLKIIFQNSPIRISITIIDILLGILFLYITTNRYFLQEVAGFSLRYYELISLSILYITLRQINKKEVFLWILLAVIISGIIQAVYGNIQLHGYLPSHHNGFKMTGSFFNPGPFAGLLSIIFPVALGMHLFSSFNWCRFKANNDERLPTKFKNLTFLVSKYVPLIGLLTLLGVLPSSQSRASWLAVIFSAVFLLTFKYRRLLKCKQLKNSRKRTFGISFIFIIIVISSCFFLYHYKKSSADGRLLTWKVTSIMIKERPWIGHGFDRFRAEYMNYQALYFKISPQSKHKLVADNVIYAFNDPMQATAENGIVGLTILIFISTLIFLAKGKGKNKFLLVISKAGLISFLIFSLFSYPSQILAIKIIIVLFLALVVSLSNYKTYTLKVQLTNLYKIIVVPFILIFMFYMYSAIVKIQDGYYRWNVAFKLYKAGLYSESTQHYKEAYLFLNQEGEFLMNYGKLLSIVGNHQKAIEILNKSKFYLSSSTIQTDLGDSFKALKEYKNAEEAYLQAFDMIPNRFYPKYLLAKLYDETNQPDKAVRTAIELLKKEVKVESDAIEEMKLEMKHILRKSELE